MIASAAKAPRPALAPQTRPADPAAQLSGRCWRKAALSSTSAGLPCAGAVGLSSARLRARELGLVGLFARRACATPLRALVGGGIRARSGQGGRAADGCPVS